MKWLATPPDHRVPPTLIGFMGTYGCREYDLASFTVEPMFLHDVLADVRPWIERAVDVRAAIHANATDPSRKDQWWWMKQYEAMIGTQFLPPDPPEPKGSTRGKPARPDSASDDGSITIIE